MQNQTHDFKEQETSYQAIVPNIDAGIPIPKNTKAALPDMTPQEELTMRSKTIKLVSDLADEVIEPTTEDIEQAEDLAREIMKNPELKPEFGNYPNETIAYLAGLVAQTSHMVAKDLADIKLSVLHGLLQVVMS